MDPYTISTEELSFWVLFCSYKHRHTFLAHISAHRERHCWSPLYCLMKKYRKSEDKVKGDIRLPILYPKKWVEGIQRGPERHTERQR